MDLGETRTPRPKDVLTKQFTYAIDNYLSFTPKAKRLEIIKLKKTCGIHPLNAATLGPNVISTNLFFSELEINKTLRQNQTFKGSIKRQLHIHLRLYLKLIRKVFSYLRIV